MKKILLTTALAFAFSMNAQILQSENFNSLNLGVISDDLTGETVGQNDWKVFATNGADPTTTNNTSANSVEIVTTGNNTTQGLKIETTNGDKGSRFMWKDGLDVAWAARTSGNNIIQLEFDFFTGSQSSSLTQNGINIYGADGTNTRILAGFVFVPSTRELTGIAYLNNNGTPGTFLIGLGPDANTDIILDNNTWYRLGVAYNTTNGQITWSGPGFDNVGIAAQFLTGPFQPVEVDFVSVTPNTNTSAATLTFDNYEVVASDVVALLSSENVFAETNFSIYPNPAQDVVNINAGNLSIKAIQIADMNGRIVKNINLDSISTYQINVQDLNSGMYLMSVFTNEGVGTSKIVKE